ncbi:hypothetical protein PWT90_10744 [Aphanocladium album]|nr:hypothetical protein PWT90_10744 [Aphanocladium album]
MPARQSKDRTTETQALPQNGLDTAAQGLAALLSSNDTTDELTDEKNKVVEEWKKDQATVKSLHDRRAEADKLLIHGKTQEDRILVQLETIKKKEAEVTRQEPVRRQAESALEKEKSTNESLKDTLKAMQDNLTRSTTKLDPAETSLATLQSFSVQLKPMAELKADIRLALEDARHEKHVRAVLLGVIPEEQLQYQDSGIDAAVGRIANALCPWISDRDAFASGLRSLCEEANGAWNLILKVDRKWSRA